MRLRARLTLVGVGVIIFLLVTPILVLYARGFMIDWKNKSFVKTGAMVVKTQPSKADLYLNDEKYKSDTPANIRFLLPGDYDVRVEKDGYQSWTKRLTVKSQLVTWANLNRDFITLFLASPRLEQSWETTQTSASRQNDQIIFATSDQIKLLNVQNGEEQTLATVKDLNMPVLADGVDIRWQNANEILNLAYNKTALDNLTKLAAKIRHAEISNGHLVILAGDELYSATGALVLIDKQVINFTLTGDEIWYVQSSLLKRYNFSNNKIDVIFETLPNASKAQIIRTNSQIYLILDSALYQLNDKLDRIYANADSAKWDDRSEQLIYYNEHEIFTYHPNQKNSELIVRSLTPMENPTINDETGYLFYQNENKIKAIELDSRDHRNIFTIADALANFALSSDGKKLFTFEKSQIKKFEIR